MGPQSNLLSPSMMTCVREYQALFPRSDHYFQQLQTGHTTTGHNLSLGRKLRLAQAQSWPAALVVAHQMPPTVSRIP
jgi:hypothetical protein